MCAIYRPGLRNSILKVSQIQLSHAVAAPILIGDCAQVVLEVARMLLLLFLYVLVKRSYFFPPHCTERKTNRYPSAGGEREREGRDYTKRWKTKLSFFIQPLSFYCDRTVKTLSSVSVFIPSTFSVFTVPLVSGAKGKQFIFRKQVSQHQIFVAAQKQPFNFVPFCMLKDDIACAVCPSRVPRLCAKRALSK